MIFPVQRIAKLFTRLMKTNASYAKKKKLMNKMNENMIGKRVMKSLLVHSHFA